MQLNLENIISFLPLIFISIPTTKTFYYLITNKYDSNLVKYTFGLIFTTVSIHLLKQIPYPKFLHKYTMRPEGAKNCDYFASKKLCNKDNPGMPSGHMGTTAFFVIYNLLHLMKKDSQFKYPTAALSGILMVMMGWARYKKKCHNIYQIIIGSLYGSGLGYFFFKNLRLS